MFFIAFSVIFLHVFRNIPQDLPMAIDQKFRKIQVFLFNSSQNHEQSQFFLEINVLNVPS
jgi:hypothetical protein